jgi:FkbM family methyltransferase
MPNLVHRLLDGMQRAAARSRLLVRFAILVRNQCRCIIKYHLAESPDVNQTGEAWLREELAPRCTFFVDVGANVGEWLAEIVRAKGATPFSAIAFEPSKTAFQRLRQRFNGDSRIDAVDRAVGDTIGSTQFFEEQYAGKGSTIVSQFTRTPGSVRSVDVTTLDGEIARRNWEHVDFLKIDAEGYDLRVLKGASALLSQRRIGVVQFEYNRSWQLAGDTLFGALSLLRSCGYDVYVLKRDGLYTLNYTLYEEYFEYSNFVAFSTAYADVAKSRYRGTI